MRVLISYSRGDEEKKQKLRQHFAPAVDSGLFSLWDRSQAPADGDPQLAFAAALEDASLALVLLSAEYLATCGGAGGELTHIAQRCQRDGLILVPILLSACQWQRVPQVAKLQILPIDRKPLWRPRKQDEALNDIVSEVVKLVKDSGGAKSAAKSTSALGSASPSERVRIGKLPTHAAALIGRQAELDQLDQSWDGPTRRHVVAVIAMGGQGKTTLVVNWLLNRMASAQYRGASRVFGWSFYRQGTSEDRGASADEFMAAALQFFGDPDPSRGSPFEKADRTGQRGRPPADPGIFRRSAAPG